MVGTSRVHAHGPGKGPSDLFASLSVFDESAFFGGRHAGPINAVGAIAWVVTVVADFAGCFATQAEKPGFLPAYKGFA